MQNFKHFFSEIPCFIYDFYVYIYVLVKILCVSGITSDFAPICLREGGGGWLNKTINFSNNKNKMTTFIKAPKADHQTYIDDKVSYFHQKNFHLKIVLKKLNSKDFSWAYDSITCLIWQSNVKFTRTFSKICQFQFVFCLEWTKKK